MFPAKPVSAKSISQVGLLFAAALPVLALSSAAVHADDSSAELGAGGLVLTHSPDIRLADEDLRINPKDVAARFTFINEGRDDIDTIVAFPLPDIDTSRFSEEPLGRTTGDPVNFVGFTVAENGKTVSFRIEQRAFYKGTDVSDVLRRAGVKLNVVDPGFTKTLDGLASERLRDLETSDLIDRESGSYPHPHWRLKAVGPATFADVRENFAPKSDIRLLVLQQAPL